MVDSTNSLGAKCEPGQSGVNPEAELPVPAKAEREAKKTASLLKRECSKMVPRVGCASIDGKQVRTGSEDLG